MNVSVYLDDGVLHCLQSLVLLLLEHFMIAQRLSNAHWRTLSDHLGLREVKRRRSANCHAWWQWLIWPLRLALSMLGIDHTSHWHTTNYSAYRCTNRLFAKIRSILLSLELFLEPSSLHPRLWLRIMFSNCHFCHGLAIIALCGTKYKFSKVV
jgi:hypothetical protein